MPVEHLSPEAAEWLAVRGYDEKMGARPLGRVIQEHVKKPLADQVLFGERGFSGTGLRVGRSGVASHAVVRTSKPRTRHRLGG